MSRAQQAWETHPDRGVDGVLRVEGPTAATTIGAVADGPGQMLHIWPHTPEGAPPLRVHDPLDGDPAVTVLALVGGAVEAGR
ncbi:hypothetical protein ACWFMI_23510 [Nocardiopsis terrae]